MSQIRLGPWPLAAPPIRNRRHSRLGNLRYVFVADRRSVLNDFVNAPGQIEPGPFITNDGMATGKLRGGPFQQRPGRRDRCGLSQAALRWRDFLLLSGLWGDAKPLERAGRTQRATALWIRRRLRRT